MAYQSVSKSASLIDAYLEAGDDVADKILADLYRCVLEPQIGSLVRKKLHVSLRETDERKENQDALELAGEAKTRIVARLSELRKDPDLVRIENLEGYIQAVTANTVNHYLRKIYPFRLRLRNQLRYQLTHDGRFAIWCGDDGEWLCGRKEWRGVKAAGSIDDLALARIIDKEDGPVEAAELGDLMAAVFDVSGAPLLFANLVTAIYDLRKIEEPAEVPEEEGRNAPSNGHDRVHDRLERGAFLKTLWGAISELPLRHRAAILLNLRNSDGDALIGLLPVTRVASIRQIAECLEMPLDEFARIWNELPWEDNKIAEHLGLTRQQVINLRQSARATLRRRIEEK